LIGNACEASIIAFLWVWEPLPLVGSIEAGILALGENDVLGRIQSPRKLSRQPGSCREGLSPCSLS
jgi:hypothetical protein